MSDDILFGDNWTRNQLEDLAPEWEFEEYTKKLSTDEVELLFEHPTGATMILSENRERVDLPCEYELVAVSGETTRDKFDWASQCIQSAKGVMKAYSAGVQDNE